MHIKVLEEMGGLDLLGTPKVDNQYHAAWAGSTPYSGMKLLASDLGGTRNPLAVRWPAKITPDATPRSQFHHCNDVVPTIYELVGSPRRGRSTGFRRTRSMGSASPTRSTTPRPRAGSSLSTSRSCAVARSTTTAGWRRPPAQGCRGSPAGRRGSRTGHPTRTSGACTTSMRTGRRPTTSPGRCPTSSRR
jgi:hypothetical protein